MQSIENVVRSPFNDELLGDDRPSDQLRGHRGFDRMEGRGRTRSPPEAGNEMFIGSGGNDVPRRSARETTTHLAASATIFCAAGPTGISSLREAGTTSSREATVTMMVLFRDSPNQRHGESQGRDCHR